MTDSKTVVEDLAAWLTAVWDEEERLAKAATPGPWRYNNAKHTHLPGSSIFEEAVFAGPAGRSATVIAATGETDDPQSMRDARHIAYHDPASALARIAADRKILEEHEGVQVPSVNRQTWGQPFTMCQRCRSHERQPVWPCTTVRLLASPYADLPGFRSEWLVERQGVEG